MGKNDGIEERNFAVSFNFIVPKKCFILTENSAMRCIQMDVVIIPWGD